VGRGGRRGSAMAPFERAMVIFYRLSLHCDCCAICICPNIDERVASVCGQLNGSLFGRTAHSFQQSMNIEYRYMESDANDRHTF